MIVFHDSIRIYPSDRGRAVEEDVETFDGSSPLKMEAVGLWEDLACTITTSMRVEAQHSPLKVTACRYPLFAKSGKGKQNPPCSPSW